MQHLKIFSPSLEVELESWKLKGEQIIQSNKTIAALAGVFSDEEARKKMDQNFEVYNVQAHLPEKEGTPGGLYFGTTILQAGKVGTEYFMTRGHFHAQVDRAEYYWCVQGSGMLILMDMERNTRAERMYPGSLHYITGKVAHRIANIGDKPLIIGACWPSDAGHNYEEIEKNGFSARLMEVNGMPTLVS